MSFTGCVKTDLLLHLYAFKGSDLNPYFYIGVCE